MVKVKKSPKKVVSKRKPSTLAKKIYGLEHEFILITGGGFIVIVMGMILFYSF